MTRAQERALRADVARFARHRQGMPAAEVDDHVQNAWVNVLERVDRVRDVRGALCWATSNSWRMELRRRRRRPALALELVAEGALPRTGTPAEQLERGESIRALLAAVASMPRLCGGILLLRDGYGMTPDAVCDELGISRRHYRDLHAAARRELDERLASAQEDMRPRE